MALRELVATFDVRVGGVGALNSLNRSIEGTKGGLEGAVGSLKAFGVALAGAFAIGKIANFFKGQAELGEQLQRTSDKLGISVEQLQKLQYAADMSGVSTEALEGALGKLEMQLGGGIAGKGGPAIETFQRLGIHMKDTEGKARPLTDMIGEFADKVAEQKDPFKRSAMAVQAFGRSGRELLPLLVKGGDGIAELSKEAEKNGFILGQDWVKSAKEAAEKQKQLDWSTRAFKATLAKELFPTINSIVDTGTKWVSNLGQIAKHTTTVHSGLAALSVVAGVKLFGSMSKLMGISRGGFIGNLFGLGKLAAIVAGIAILYLAWDDLFGLFTGKKSEIGDLIDKAYGKGQSTKDVNALTTAWNDLVAAITGANTESATLGDTWEAFTAEIKTELAGLTHMLMGFATVSLNFVSAMKKSIAGDKDADASWTKLSESWKNFNVGNDAKMVVDKGNTELGKKGEKDVAAFDPNWRAKLSPEQLHAWRKKQGVSDQGAVALAPPVINQTITIHGGDPDKVKAAVKQGTTESLSQNDLRHTHNAVQNKAPAVNQ